ncbi:M16 family metallopeptidase [Pedobacter polysacchareus]|uniref:M16 family metallopeptidase n=1 Tax=Pedobacter polysacchareus TaxID=2861973 RepID=UPI001C99D2A4|nr:M16 family metallopeptidase [Pedobacter polysacchareus]
MNTPNFKISLIIGLIFFTALSAGAQNKTNKYQWKTASSAGYSYKYITNDPAKARFYTLKNGLTVILSENKKEPRITSKIAVRAGSNTDPKEHTGLAHYLEHLLFKGTDKYGSLDWKKEQPLIQEIEERYEQYNKTTDVAKRKAMYRGIDSVSVLASKYAIANEYDKLMGAMGGQGTNAHTWVEETVYEEDIPSSAVDKFLTVQAERFRNPVFRLFHTELEAVYEEKNESLDNDGWKIQQAMHHYLFPTHNYGQQSTIGTIEHLKNPSLKAIRKYYNDYYVPNNMAVIMVGDFKSDELVKKIDQYMGYMKAAPVKEYKPVAEKPLAGPIVQDIYGPTSESLALGYRIAANGTKNALMAGLVAEILSNGKAGLLDLNLSQPQKVLQAGAYTRQYKDYGIFSIYAAPKEGQSLKEVKDLVLAQIELLKTGNFSDALLKAIVANQKLTALNNIADNASRAEDLMSDYIKSNSKNWIQEVSRIDDLEKVTKAEIVSFSKAFFADNYVVLNKYQGEGPQVDKVEKPPITAVETNAGSQSDFLKMVGQIPAETIAPKWLDFQKDIQHGKFGAAEIYAVQNKDNQLFRQYFQFEMGKWNSKLLPVAAAYLSFLSHDKKFYELACNFFLNVDNQVTTIGLTGLQENYSKAMQLLKEVLSNGQVDQSAFTAMKENLLKNRQNNKLNKGSMMQAMLSYAAYGKNNPYNFTMTDAEINNLKPEELIAVLRDLFQYKYSVIYYGPAGLPEYKVLLQADHQVPTQFKAYPEAMAFKKLEQNENKVLFTDYNMLQADVSWYRNANVYAPAQEVTADLFNNYFGFGMGSVVFQTLRESKALAYSTSAVYGKPRKKEDQFYVTAFIGCQADKVDDAIKGMNALLNDLPYNEKAFQSAKMSLATNLETERIMEDRIIFSYIDAKRKGLDYDLRKEAYAAIPKLSFSAIKKLHQDYFANQAYTYCIVGSQKNLPLSQLSNYGKVESLSLETLFGY